LLLSAVHSGGEAQLANSPDDEEKVLRWGDGRLEPDLPPAAADRSLARRFLSGVEALPRQACGAIAVRFAKPFNRRSAKIVVGGEVILNYLKTPWL
jgi:hypothetical protein